MFVGKCSFTVSEKFLQFYHTIGKNSYWFSGSLPWMRRLHFHLSVITSLIIWRRAHKKTVGKFVLFFDYKADNIILLEAKMVQNTVYDNTER